LAERSLPSSRLRVRSHFCEKMDEKPARQRAEGVFNEKNDHSIHQMKFLNKCVGFKVMEFFLTHPTLEIHLNELARKL